MKVGAVKAPHYSEEPNMQAITTVGLDIAKSVFQVHGVDAAGQVVIPATVMPLTDITALSWYSPKSASLFTFL
jgi:hypothetical protein